MDLISERAAARRLATCGLSLSASQHLLATGIAGEPIRTAAATLYDSSAIEELASRPALSRDETRELFPDGAVVARLPRGRIVAAGSEWPDTAEVLSGPWPIPPGPSVALLARFWTGRTVPLLLTVSGTVLSGATATQFAPSARRSGEFDASFALETPGRWLGRARGRMLRFGRGATIELLGDLAWARIDRTGRSSERARR
ncbi:hypothetical protein [Nocardioides ultimimeridianus]